MDVSVAGPRTRILVLTSEIELMRLVRSVLEPTGCMVAADQLFAATAKADGPFDIVMVDLPALDLDQLRQAKRAYSDAHLIAICGSYREADCIAVLDLDADYLPLVPSAHGIWRRACASPNCGASTRQDVDATIDVDRL